MTREKEKRRERQCANIYAQAGFEVHNPPRTRNQMDDIFGLFDLLAIGPQPTPVHLVQVKSNRPRGVTDWAAQAIGYLHPSVQPSMAVCYDGEGWRLIDPVPGGYETVVDERDLEGNMGEGLRAFLDPDSPEDERL